MEIIDRYIYMVTKQLPKNEKAGVEKELLLLIEARVAQAAVNLTEEEKVRLVLENLGNPVQLANQYRKQKRYLIGPKYFAAYLSVLKIVLFSIIIGFSVLYAIGLVFNPSEEILLPVLNYLNGLFQLGIQGVVWVTGIFAVLEYYQVKLEDQKVWKLENLPKRPSDKQRISRGETIFGLIFSTVFFIFLYPIFYPQQSSVSGDFALFDLTRLNQLKGLVLFLFFLGIFQEVLKLIWGRWNKRNVWIYLGITALSTGLTVYLIAYSGIWHQGMNQVLKESTGFSLEYFIQTVSVFIVIISLLDVGSVLYKGYLPQR